MTKFYLPADNHINYVYGWNCFSHFFYYMNELLNISIDGIITHTMCKKVNVSVT